MMLDHNPTIDLKSRFVDWRVFAAWLDTEGSVSSILAKNRTRNNRTLYKREHELTIYQADEAALETLRSFLREAGVSATYMYKNQRTGVWALRLTRIRDIELVISEVEPFLITENKKRQIERFKRFRSERYHRIGEVAA
jgi:hypothetical protein